jgi:hypothetical protein
VAETPGVVVVIVVVGTDAGAVVVALVVLTVRVVVLVELWPVALVLGGVARAAAGARSTAAEAIMAVVASLIFGRPATS